MTKRNKNKANTNPNTNPNTNHWIKESAPWIFGFLFCLIGAFVCYLIYKQRKEYLKKHEPVLFDIKNKIEKMIPYFTEDEKYRLSRLKLQPDIKSYTIDKHDMHLCLENTDGNYYDENILIYVTIHELAHIFCDEIGHTENYMNIFNNLLDIAERVGIYNPSINLPKEYCGVKIKNE